MAPRVGPVPSAVVVVEAAAVVVVGAVVEVEDVLGAAVEEVVGAAVEEVVRAAVEEVVGGGTVGSNGDEDAGATMVPRVVAGSMAPALEVGAADATVVGAEVGAAEGVPLPGSPPPTTW